VNINESLSDEAILSEIGQRLAAIRLNRNRTRAQLAGEAGVSMSTLARLETGEVATRLSGFLRVCRALDLLGAVDALIPKPAPSPLAILKLHGRSRKRASAVGHAARPTKTWTWSDRE
jgi:putative transcriptional regulator